MNSVVATRLKQARDESKALLRDVRGQRRPDGQWPPYVSLTGDRGAMIERLVEAYREALDIVRAVEKVIDGR